MGFVEIVYVCRTLRPKVLLRVKRHKVQLKLLDNKCLSYGCQKISKSIRSFLVGCFSNFEDENQQDAVTKLETE
jgi:hypothetical protein